MIDHSLNALPATEIAARVRAGSLRCEDIAQACLDRIDRREPTIQAWSFLDRDMVFRQARALDSQAERGPMHGVPVGVKDIIETFDMPTQMGSPIYRGYRTRSDASCVALLRAAGALILGKTVTCEFAGTTAGETTNPHNPSHTPGGSSSGSGAAVADFMAAVALGTQTGGSVQRPASYCGIVGYKPTFGLINRQGVKPAAESLDTVGLMARTVEDVELAMRVLTNAEPVGWLPQKTPVRVGVCRNYAWETAELATREAVDNAAAGLAKSGFSVSEVILPASFDDLPMARVIVNDFERARGMAFEWHTHRDLISASLAKTISNGFAIPRERYLDACMRVENCRKRLGDGFTDVDVLLVPAAQGEAPLGLSETGNHRFQSIWTQLGTPAVTLPTHAGARGLPVGIQLVGAPYADNRLLAVAELVFRTLGRGPVVKY